MLRFRSLPRPVGAAARCLRLSRGNLGRRIVLRFNDLENVSDTRYRITLGGLNALRSTSVVPSPFPTNEGQSNSSRRASERL